MSVHSSPTGHTPTVPVPVIDRRHVDYLRHNHEAVVVQSLTDGAVYLHTSPSVDPFDAYDLLVLLTYDDVLARVAASVRETGKTPTSAQIAKAVNLDLFAMHARGEFPTLDDIEEVIAEMSAVEHRRVI